MKNYKIYQLGFEAEDCNDEKWTIIEKALKTGEKLDDFYGLTYCDGDYMNFVFYDEDGYRGLYQLSFEAEDCTDEKWKMIEKALKTGRKLDDFYGLNYCDGDYMNFVFTEV